MSWVLRSDERWIKMKKTLVTELTAAVERKSCEPQGTGEKTRTLLAVTVLTGCGKNWSRKKSCSTS